MIAFVLCPPWPFWYTGPTIMVKKNGLVPDGRDTASQIHLDLEHRNNRSHLFHYSAIHGQSRVSESRARAYIFSSLPRLRLTYSIYPNQGLPPLLQVSREETSGDQGLVQEQMTESSVSVVPHHSSPSTLSP